MTAREVYDGSNGEATKAMYAELEALGLIGLVALNLFRASKASERAKKYRGRAGRGQPRYRDLAYEKKDFSLGQLCQVLEVHGQALGIRYGWKHDDAAEFGPSWVLYVDLPTGQASYHCPSRKAGPDYPGDWDGAHESASRVVHFVQHLRVWKRWEPGLVVAPIVRVASGAGGPVQWSLFGVVTE